MQSPYIIMRQLKPETSHPWRVGKFDSNFLAVPCTVGYATEKEAQEVKADLEIKAGYRSPDSGG